MGDPVTGILRIHPEPYTYVDEKTTHNALTSDPVLFFTFIEKLFFSIAKNTVPVILPSKQIFEDSQKHGDFRVMPCITGSGPDAVKTVKIVGTNYSQQSVPDQVTVGKVFCLHPEENYISHMFEACLLSSARTAAFALIALRILRKPRNIPITLGIIGTGRVGYYTTLFSAAMGLSEQIRIFDIDGKRAEHVAVSVNKAYPGSLCSADNRKSVLQSNALVLCTTSTEPVVSPHETDATPIISVGADTSFQHELSHEWADRKPIIVDTFDCKQVGDVKVWLQEGLIDENDMIDLLTVIRTSDLPNHRFDPPTIVISTGSALMDNLTVQYILKNQI